MLSFWCQHPGGGHIALADTSVRFIRYAAAGVLAALATRRGGDKTTGAW